MLTNQNLSNLLSIGNLKSAPNGLLQAQTLMTRAATSLLSSQAPTISTHDAFVVAYEGMFAVVMAVLAMHDLQPGSQQGHRVTAIQAALAAVGLNSIDQQLASQVHQVRNERIYKMAINANAKNLSDAQYILDKSLTLAKALLAQATAAAAPASVAAAAIPASAPIVPGALPTSLPGSKTLAGSKKKTS